MKIIFDKVSTRCSKITTRAYSTSFSLGIHFLDKKLHEPIYAIYGFVRLADEIVDSFHGYDKGKLLNDFKHEAYSAIESGISLNPILNSFQSTVNQYGIERDLIDKFLQSMEMDLEHLQHDHHSFNKYILGSAEVVGLMCLRVFCDGDSDLYDDLKTCAMRLGAAFQKVNFLRDLGHDYHKLKRSYFPGLDLYDFCNSKKAEIEQDIRLDFNAALEGIRRLPGSARFGVYVAYIYYRNLFERIERAPGEMLLEHRLRLPGYQKFVLLLHSFLRYNFGGL